MTLPMPIHSHPISRTFRWLVWGGAACLLMLPLVAMQFTTNVRWTALDFLVMGALLLVVCGAFELTLRKANGLAYLLGAAAATLAGFMIVWSNLAVGIIGVQENPLNLIFFGAVATALVGAGASRLAAKGLAWSVTAAAVIHAAGCAAALLAGTPREFLLSLLMLAPWVLSSLMFRRASA